MDSSLWSDILSHAMTLIVGGGLVKLLTVFEERRAIKAQTKITEAEAREKQSEVAGKDIHNTEDIVRVYKDALKDFKEYYEQKEQLLLESNEELREEIKKLQDLVAKIQSDKAELSTSLRRAELKIEELNNLIKNLQGNANV